MPILLAFTVLLPLLVALRGHLALPQARSQDGSRDGSGDGGDSHSLLSVVFLIAFPSEWARGGSDTTPGTQFAFVGDMGRLGWSWISFPPGPGIRFALGLDGVSLCLLSSAHRCS